MEEFSYSGVENLNVMKIAKFYNNSIFNWIRKSVKKDSLILDFGSGIGEYCNRFSKNIYALEIDTQLHKSIKCEAYSRIEDVNKTFDVIYSINVLEHIENDAETVAKLIQKLNVNGVLKVFVPAKKNIYSNMDKIVGHVRRYEKEDIARIFNNANINVVYCRYFDSIGWFMSYIFKLLKLDNKNLNKVSVFIYDRFIFPISRLIDIITFGRIIGKNLIIEAVRVE